jgi:hypothetical protein
MREAAVWLLNPLSFLTIRRDRMRAAFGNFAIEHSMVMPGRRIANWNSSPAAHIRRHTLYRKRKRTRGTLRQGRLLWRRIHALEAGGLFNAGSRPIRKPATKERIVPMALSSRTEPIARNDPRCDIQQQLGMRWAGCASIQSRPLTQTLTLARLTRKSISPSFRR